MREFSIALFLVSGVLKAQLWILFPWFPDITALAVIMMVLSFILSGPSFAARVGVFPLVCLLLFLAFFLSVVASALYSSSNLVVLKLTKTSIIVGAFLVALTTADLDWKRFAFLYVILIFITALLFIYIFPQYRLGLLGADAEFYGGSYLGFGNSCAIAIILYFSLFDDQSFFTRFSVITYFVFCMMLAGARAPIIFLVVLSIIWSAYRLIVWAVNSRSMSRSSLLALIVAAPLFLVSLVFISEVEYFGETNIFKTVGYSIDRLLLLFGDAKGESFNVRVNHFSETIKAIDASPFNGVGLASYGLSVMGNDLWDYPHNIFLEVWVESGLLSLVFLMGLISLVLFRVLILERHLWLLFILVYCLLNAMKSVSFSDNRILFFWLGVAVVYSTQSNIVRRKYGRDG